MQYFYKEPYKLDIESFSFGDEATNPQVSDIAETARELGAEVVSVNKSGPTVLLSLNDVEPEKIEKVIGAKLFPNYEYEPAVCADDVSFFAPVATPANAVGPHKFSFQVEGTDGKVIADARVKVSLRDEKFATGISGADGKVEFMLRDNEVASVQVQPQENYWCAAHTGGKANSEVRKLILECLELPFDDSLRHFHPAPSKSGGAGINVAVIDTGINQHVDLPALQVARTFLLGVPSEGCTDNEQNHGTHVAGIIAGKRYGLAPNVNLFGYSVFPKPGGKARTIDITLAIDQAVEDGADIINLSLGMDKDDDAIEAAIERAVDEGVLVVAATGNSGTAQVSFPARLPDACAVGAIGVKDAFAPSSIHRTHEARDTKADYFVPRFSNFGQGMVNSCAPGVAVVSTVRTAGYLAKSGTSMASPIVAAHAARLLASHPEVASLTGRKRVEELRKLLYNGSQNHQFDSAYVGMGVPSSD